MHPPLGDVPPQALADARLQAHHAAQLVSAPGTTLLPPAEDFSHTALAFDPSGLRLLGADLGDGLRAALRVPDLTLQIERAGQGAAELALAGHTPSEGLAWLQAELSRVRSDVDGLQLPEHDLPPHPVASGARFHVEEPAVMAELAAYFALAHGVLGEVAAGRRGPWPANPLCLWPHHFDLATLLTVDAQGGASVGVGLSPGDASYDEPYFYVTPWPYPDAPPDAPLAAGGRWHTSGWTGAVLTAGDLLAGGARDELGSRAAAFVASAITACADLLGREGAA